MAEEELRIAVERLLLERPSIDGALRNLLSLRLAQIQSGTAPPANLVKVTGAGGGGLEQQQQQQQQQQQLGAPEFLRIVRAVLKLVNSSELESLDSWLAKHPQEDDERGLERINAIVEYKAASFVSKKIQQAKEIDNNKKTVAKSLGKSFWQVLWPQIEEEVVSEVSDIVDRETLTSSILSEMLQQQHEDEELIWTANLNEILEKRMEGRRLAAEARTEGEAIN